MLAVLAGAAPALAKAQAAALVTSMRAGAWSSDRLATESRGVANVEFWARASTEIGAGAKGRFEGWLGADPVGVGEVRGDVREAFVDWRGGAWRVRAGRQVDVWGRIDRLAPTDVIGARDYRRLVEDDDDNRLGVAGVRIEHPLGGGILTGAWLPEFRGTRLPDNYGRYGLALDRASPDHPAGQFAVRYERFGERLDGSISVARLYDRTPWLALQTSGGAVRLVETYPRLTVVGADMATTIGPYNVRAEGAVFDRSFGAAAPFVARTSRASFALGVDRDFPGQLNLNVVAFADLAGSERGVAAGPALLVARGNAAIHRTWRRTVIGGAARLRKGFDGDRGALEASAGAFDGGGDYLQAKGSYAIRDGVRLTAMAERFAGDDGGFFGRLRRNSTFTAGLRVGF